MIDTTRAIDISMDLNARTVVWVDDPQPELRPVCRQPDAECNFTWLSFGAHAGTHIDAPYYLFSDQWTVDQIPLSRLVGPCQVVDVTEVDDVVDVADVAEHTIDSERVLLRTRNSFDPMDAYNPRHVALSAAAAGHLIDQGVETLGFDYQSFERHGANEIHRIFLERNVTLIDNLRLRDAPAGRYTLVCLPVKLTGIDGAPARAVLLP